MGRLAHFGPTTKKKKLNNSKDRMVKFTGTFKRKTEENYDAFLAKVGVSFMLRSKSKFRNIKSGNTKGGSITVLLASCLTGLESAVWQLIIFLFICKTD